MPEIINVSFVQLTVLERGRVREWESACVTGERFYKTSSTIRKFCLLSDVFLIGCLQCIFHKFTFHSDSLHISIPISAYVPVRACTGGFSFQFYYTWFTLCKYYEDKIKSSFSATTYCSAICWNLEKILNSYN